MGELREQTEALLWRELVDQAIPGHKAPDGRRRQLALAVFAQRRLGSVRRNAMENLTTDLARAYVEKTPKTLTRDIGVLLEKGLLRTDGKGTYRAGEEKILGLMPIRAIRPDA